MSRQFGTALPGFRRENSFNKSDLENFTVAGKEEVSVVPSSGVTEVGNEKSWSGGNVATCVASQPP